MNEVIKHFQNAYDKLKSTTIPQLPLEIAVIETTDISNLKQVDEATLNEEVEIKPKISEKSDIQEKKERNNPLNF